MKILFATAGVAPAQENADYVMNISKRLGAELIAVHIENKRDVGEDGHEALSIISKSGKKAHVQVTSVLQTGDIISHIIKIAESEPAAMIIMGASREKPYNEWISTQTKKKTNIPVLVIPHD